MHKLVPYTTALTLLAFAGAAGAESDPLAEWDDDVLADDWRISQVMDSVVLSRARDHVGVVHDVLIDEAGYIDSLIVRRKPDDDATTLWESDSGHLYFQVDWSDADFNPALTEIVLDKSHKEIETLAHKETPAFQDDNEYEASGILGMPVHGNEVPAYGEIQDLLFSRTIKQLTAFIVDVGGDGTHLVAVPIDMAAIDYQESIIELPYRAEDFDALEEFEYVEPG